MPARDFEFVGFTADQLPALLSELDVELASESLDTPCRIVIAGGAAIALRVPSRVTGDVDVVSEGMPAAVRRAAERVASRHGLRPDWINDAAKLKTVAVAADPEPVFEGARLVVESAGPRYILAMKLVSARPVGQSRLRGVGERAPHRPCRRTAWPDRAGRSMEAEPDGDDAILRRRSHRRSDPEPQPTAHEISARVG